MSKSVAIIGTRGYPSYYGGFETAVRRLAPYFADHGWDVTVYGRKNTTRPGEAVSDSRIRSVQTPGIETKAVSTLSYGFTASIHATLEKPDVALVMNVANGFYLPLLKARGIPTLVNVDGIEWDRDKWGRFAKRTFRLGAQYTARFADEIVVDSLAIGSRWSQEFDRDGVFIPYGGDESPSSVVESGLVRGNYVLAVARFVPENTVPEFLKAAEVLARKWTVVIVGSTGYNGPLDVEAKALSDRNPNVRWLGHVSDDSRLHALWQNCGTYFHGHSVGGTNPALVQAMALGAPTVARDTIYNREVLGPQGEFCAPTPSDIVESVTALMSDPSAQERARANGLSRAQDEYTWDSVCARYLAQLEQLAGK
jgi:glycosyltransferase involved in cell wall biosynthesis